MAKKIKVLQEHGHVIRHLTMLRVCQLIKTNHGWNLVVTLIDTAKEIKFLQERRHAIHNHYLGVSAEC
jgi:hypothetical protein